MSPAVLGPLDPIQLFGAARRGIWAASRRVRPDHQTIARREVWFSASNMTLLFLYAAVAPSRRSARAFDASQVQRARAFAQVAFPDVFDPVPTIANDSLTLFATSNGAGIRERALYVHPTGLIELLWALPVPDDPAQEFSVEASEVARIVLHLSSAISSEQYARISRAGSGRRKFVRVDWLFNLSTNISSPSGPRSWAGLTFPSEQPPRARHDWAVAPPDGYGAKALLNSKRSRPGAEIASILLDEIAIANGYYDAAAAVATAAVEAQRRFESKPGAPTDAPSGPQTEDFDDMFQSILEDGLKRALAAIPPDRLARLAVNGVAKDDIEAAILEASDEIAQSTASELKRTAPDIQDSPNRFGDMP